MDDGPVNQPGLISRLLADPIGLRRGSRLVLLGLLVLVIAGQLLSGPGGGMLTALSWVCAPIVAGGIGAGDAFFIRNGRGGRRILLTIIASLFTALTACVILAGISNSSGSPTRETLVAALHASLYAGIVLGLAGLIAVGIGRGEAYVSRRIERMSDEDW